MKKAILILCLSCFLLSGCSGVKQQSYQKIETGMFQSYKIDKNGTLWVWGTTVGRETDVPEGAKFEDYPLTEPAVLAENVSAVSTGESFVLILKNDGTLWGCGTYPGTGTKDNILSDPQKLMDNVKSISAEGLRLMAVDKNGTLWDWGRTNVNDLSSSVHHETRPVELMDGVDSVFTSDSRTLFIKPDGSLWWWRPSSFEEIITEPQKLMSDVVLAAAGDDVFAAISDDKKLWRWDDPSADAVMVSENIIFAAVDSVAGNDVLIYITGDGELWSDSYDFETGMPVTAPVKLLNNVKEAAFCGDSLIALDNDGVLHGWGSNSLFTLSGCDIIHSR